MKKYRKVLAGIFAAGVLVCGIGAGIGFVEFLSLDYAGERNIGETEMAVMEGEMELSEPSDSSKIQVYMDYGQPYLDIEWDDTVPEQVMKYRIEYNKKEVQPEAWQDDRGFLGFSFSFVNVDEVKDLMEARDMILKDLKENKIGSYQKKDIESIVLSINPKNQERIEIW